jgi:hypothetical protein
MASAIEHLVLWVPTLPPEERGLPDLPHVLPRLVPLYRPYCEVSRKEGCKHGSIIVRIHSLIFTHGDAD